MEQDEPNEFQIEIKRTYFAYGIQPTIIIISFLVTAAAVSAALNQFGLNTNFWLDIPKYIALVGIVVALFPIAKKVITLFKNEDALNETYGVVKEALKGKKRRSPEDYVYIEEEQIRQYYSFFRNDVGIISTQEQATGSSLTAGINTGVSAGGAVSSTHSSVFRIDAESLFEAEEKQFRKYRMINSLSEVDDDQPCWVHGKITKLWGRSDGDCVFYSIIDSGPQTQSLAFQREHFTPKYKSYFSLKPTPELNISIEMLCSIIKSGSRIIVNPIIILRNNSEIGNPNESSLPRNPPTIVPI